MDDPSADRFEHGFSGAQRLLFAALRSFAEIGRQQAVGLGDCG
jgi:hypothetical protein